MNKINKKQMSNSEALELAKPSRSGTQEFFSSFWNKLKERFIAFSKEKYYYYLAFGIPVIILFLTYAFLEMHPFGEKSILTLDMDGQYIYFFEQIRDVYTGQSSLFYTFERCLGGEFLGYFTYYLASPLSYVVVLFPASMITEAVMFIFMLKSGFAGLTFSIYLSKTRKKNVSGFIMFPVMYALCSYATMYQFNTMWMDALIWLPLITLGIESLVKEGRFKLFVISLAMGICSNYYIGYMLCIYVAIYFFFFLCSKSPEELNGLNETNHGFKSFARIAVASVIALMMAAAIIFSAYYSLGFGKSSFQDNSMEADLRFDFMHLLAKMFLGSFDTVRLVGTPNVYAGILPLMLLPIFYATKKVSMREKISFTVLALIFVGSFSINTLDLMWHGFQTPVWFNYRYSFMFSFVILLMAYRGYECYNDYDVSFFGKTTAVLALLLFIIQKTVVLVRYEYVDGGWTGIDTIPGLSMIWLSLLFLLIYLAIRILFKQAMFKRISSVLLVSMVCVEAFVNSYINWDGELKDGGVAYRDNYREYADKITDVSDYIKDMDPTFYRMDHVFLRKYNDNFLADMNGLSEFTSTFNASTGSFMGKLGFFTNNPTVKYSMSTPITDSLLGVKYVIGYSDIDSNGKLPGLNSVYHGYKPITSKSGFIIYENPYVLPIAYKVDKNMDKSFEESEFFDGNRSFASTSKNLISSMLGKETDIFKVCRYSTANGTLKSTSLDSEGGKSFYKPDTEDSAYFYFTVQAHTNGNIYMHLPSPWTTAAELYVDDVLIHSNFFQNENKSVVDLGYYEQGEVVTVRLEFSHWRIYLWDTKDYFVQIDQEAFDNAINELKAGGLKIDEYSDTHISGTINSAEDGCVFTTIPYDSNWKVYVDGERVETYEMVDAMLGFDISKGVHTIEFEYVHTPFITGAIISVIGIGLFVLLCFLDARWRKAHPICSKVEECDTVDTDAEATEQDNQDISAPIENNNTSEDNNDLPS